ncbi:hypothetical protein [Desulfobacula sp.]|uniref:hypothetical protein n=1 Tax=Desulfobacula sp. TaxID=2593537 RepID=UPI0026286ACF|nr:hypothetical protein [Desulfobacula sp.]
MKLILFVHQNASSKGTTFRKLIKQNFKGLEIETFQTFNGFKTRLKQVSLYDQEIFVLFTDSKDRLKELTSLIDLLEGKRILLILPDDSNATTSVAHHFFPRYFTYVNDTYDDLCAVLIKMTQQEKKIKIVSNNNGGN